MVTAAIPVPKVLKLVPPGPTRPAPLRVGKGKRVGISYTLRTNGEIRHIRSSDWGDKPLEYVHGDGRLLAALERGLEGKLPGDSCVVTIPPEEAYGERERALQQQVPASMFGGVDRVEEGMCFIARSEDDQHFENVMITQIDKEQGIVLVDTNHPLAGMTLEFTVKIVSVCDANADGTSPAEGGPGTENLIHNLIERQAG